MTYENFINTVENNLKDTVKMGMGDLGYGMTVQIQDENIKLVVSFDNEERFSSLRFQRLKWENENG